MKRREEQESIVNLLQTCTEAVVMDVRIATPHQQHSENEKISV
jgi:hypothetical protein